MIDIQLLRQDPQAVAASLRRRGFELDAPLLARLDGERRAAQVALDALAQARNEAARAGERPAPGANHAGARELRAGARERLDLAEAALRAFLMELPNMPAPEVPDGADARANRVIRQSREPSDPGFPPLPHDELGALHGGLDFEQAARLSGARFAVAFGPIARLHRALVQFMLDLAVDEHGYREVQTPYLVRAEALEGTGQLPKFKDDLFEIARDGLYLIPTAEVPVTNLLAGMRLGPADLPAAFAAHTPCFRREAGSAGRDVKGLIRQHQFEKVELVRACDPDAAPQEFETLLCHAQEALDRLEAPWRAVELCAGDLGFGARRTVDLEVWVPSQKAWREISSVSDFGDFQARRMGAKFVDAQGRRRHLNTLNGSALAAGRALVAVMENHQRPDGSIGIPKALRPYMRGLDAIEPPAPTRARPGGPGR